jgi:hypothetical protein
VSGKNSAKRQHGGKSSIGQGNKNSQLFLTLATTLNCPGAADAGRFKRCERMDSVRDICRVAVAERAMPLRIPAKPNRRPSRFLCVSRGVVVRHKARNSLQRSRRPLVDTNQLFCKQPIQ